MNNYNNRIDKYASMDDDVVGGLMISQLVRNLKY